MRFDEYKISDTIKNNLKDLGFKKPTDIQYRVIPHILNRHDILAIAPTGTGKTAAFVIPIIHKILRTKTSKRSDFIQCLIMVPTRELSLQIHEVFNTIGKHTGIKTLALFGGVDQEPQIERLLNGIDVLITTPGRMFDLTSQGFIKLRKTEILVLDEADHMLDLGFIKDIRDLITYLPHKRQTLFFSATINKEIKKLAYSLVNKPIHIQISPKNPVAKNIEHGVAFIEMDDKRYFLERLVTENPKTKILVFVRTKVRAERVQKAMERVTIIAETIHGGKTQEERLTTLDKFRTGELKLLIATDVSARGIDIPSVDFVVNYDLPDRSETYVHRVGRTGRGNLKGQALSFCSTDEKPILEMIEDGLDKPIAVIKIAKREYIEIQQNSDDHKDDIKSMMKEIEELEYWNSNKKKKNRSNRKKK